MIDIGVSIPDVHVVSGTAAKKNVKTVLIMIPDSLIYFDQYNTINIHISETNQ